MGPANRRTRRGSCESPEHLLWLPENLPRARFEPELAAAVGFHSPRRSPVDQRLRAVAQLGSALDWGSRGRRFKSCQPDRETASGLRRRRSEAVGVSTPDWRIDGFIHSLLRADRPCGPDKRAPAGARQPLRAPRISGPRRAGLGVTEVSGIPELLEQFGDVGGDGRLGDVGVMTPDARRPTPDARRQPGRQCV
jgi:hypothetical protein